MTDEPPPDDRADGPTDPSDDSPAADPIDHDVDRADSGPPDEPRPEGQADGGYSDDRPQESPEDEHATAVDEAGETETETGGLSDRAAFWISVAIGVVLSVGSIALVSGRAPFFEDILRVRPTVEGGGVGADWIVGNTEPVLEWLIVLVHFADVVMGIFILLMVFVHWAAFRRLAARMRPPASATETGEATAATDGGPRSGAADRESRGGDGSRGGDRP